MKKYLFFFVLCLFSFCYGIVFAEENLVAQTTVVRVGNLTFQLPAGFVKDNDPKDANSNILYYERETGEFSSESIGFSCEPKEPNMTEEQIFSAEKELRISVNKNVNQSLKFEELYISGKKVLFIFESDINSVDVYFCENGFKYNIYYFSIDMNYNYNPVRAFLINIVRLAR